jgi:hypothetical protein
MNIRFGCVQKKIRNFFFKISKIWKKKINFKENSQNVSQKNSPKKFQKKIIIIIIIHTREEEIFIKKYYLLRNPSATNSS